MIKLAERHRQFAELHASGCFVIPNPWDIGTAKLFAAKGAQALATTSAGQAFTLGRPDMGTISQDEALDHAADIVAATPLPVSGDLENGFGNDPDTVAETIRLAREAGLSGCGIEDTMMQPGNPAYDFELAVERIRAAADAAKALPDPFILTARADGVMNDAYDFAEGIRRLQAFEQAGANCVYMPAFGDPNLLSELMSAVSGAVNVLATGAMAKMGKDALAASGVRRISIGSIAARVVHAATLEMADEMLVHGRFDGFAKAARGSDIDALLAKGSGLKA
ncbi:MAG: isocitrate lyase/phosphoenolpyruvate mutase family protein [Pseudomonadota bacterium]